MIERQTKSFGIATLLTLLGLTIHPTLSMADVDCPVTQPNDWPISVETAIRLPMRDDHRKTHDWYGSSSLAALIPIDGQWIGVGNQYANKFWWWREGFDAIQEAKPDLVISALRLDGPAPPVLISDATSGVGKDWHAMLIGMHFPTSGCWEIRGTYKGSQALILTVLVGDSGEVN